MMRVQRQQVQQEEEAFGNPWSKVLSGNEEKPWPALVLRSLRSAALSSSKGNTKTRMAPRPPDTPPPRKSKGTQTENEKEKGEEEEEEQQHKEEERYNFVKNVNAMISFLINRRKCFQVNVAVAPTAKSAARFLGKTSALPTPAPCRAPHPRPRR